MDASFSFIKKLVKDGQALLDSQVSNAVNTGFHRAHKVYEYLHQKVFDADGFPKLSKRDGTIFVGREVLWIMPGNQSKSYIQHMWS